MAQSSAAADSFDAVTGRPWASAAITVLPGCGRAAAFVLQRQNSRRAARYPMWAVDPVRWTVASWTAVEQERHEMMHIAANISSENGQERPIGCARNFPFDTREKRSDQQHGGYPFNGHAVRVRWHGGVSRGFIERSMRAISESLHGCRRVVLNIVSLRNREAVPN